MAISKRYLGSPSGLPFRQPLRLTAKSYTQWCVCRVVSRRCGRICLAIRPAKVSCTLDPKLYLIFGTIESASSQSRLRQGYPKSLATTARVISQCDLPQQVSSEFSEEPTRTLHSSTFQCWCFSGSDGRKQKG